jgi:tetratricopeptide (TPR) repeat protein
MIKGIYDFSIKELAPKMKLTKLFCLFLAITLVVVGCKKKEPESLRQGQPEIEENKSIHKVASFLDKGTDDVEQQFRQYIIRGEQAEQESNKLEKIAQNKSELHLYDEAAKSMREAISIYEKAEKEFERALELVVDAHKKTQENLEQVEKKIVAGGTYEDKIQEKLYHLQLLKLKNLYNEANHKKDISEQILEIMKNMLVNWEELGKIDAEDKVRKQEVLELERNVNLTVFEIGRLRRRFGEITSGVLSLITNRKDHPNRERLIEIMEQTADAIIRDSFLIPIYSDQLPNLFCILQDPPDFGSIGETGGVIYINKGGRPEKGITTMAVDFETGKKLPIVNIESQSLERASISLEKWINSLREGGICLEGCSCFVIFSDRLREGLIEAIGNTDETYSYLLKREGHCINLYRIKQGDQEQYFLIASEQIFYLVPPPAVGHSGMATKKFLESIGLWMEDGEVRIVMGASDLSKLILELSMLKEWGGEISPLIKRDCIVYQYPTDIPISAMSLKLGNLIEEGNLRGLYDISGIPFVESHYGFNSYSGHLIYYGLKWLAMERLMQMGLFGSQEVLVIDNGQKLWLALKKEEYPKDIMSLPTGAIIESICGWGEPSTIPHRPINYTIDNRYVEGSRFMFQGKPIALMRSFYVDVPFAQVRTFRNFGQRTQLIQDEIEANFLHLLSFPLEKEMKITWDPNDPNGLVTIVVPGTLVLFDERFNTFSSNRSKIPSILKLGTDKKLESAYCVLIDPETGEKTYLDHPPVGGVQKTSLSDNRAKAFYNLGQYYEGKKKFDDAEACFSQSLGREEVYPSNLRRPELKNDKP